MKLYSHPKCSTCKKAIAFLDTHNISYELVDITTRAPTVDELSLSSAATVKGMFNTSGMQYRAEGIKEKLEDMSKEDVLSLLENNGMLVKRPVLVLDNVVLQGFKESAWTEALSTHV